MKYQLVPHIRTPEDLGVAAFGNPHFSIAPTAHKNRINRAEYGRRLAELEGGIFTSNGYFVPIENERCH